MGCHPTGVAAICAMADGTPIGLAASSFTSVSLEPPLVLFCIANTSATWAQMKDCAGFAASILAENQEGVCGRLAQKGVDRFAALSWHPAPSGAPVIAGAVAWFDCEFYSRHAAGDHEIVVGLVTSLGLADSDRRAPLVFHQGGFGLR